MMCVANMPTTTMTTAASEESGPTKDLTNLEAKEPNNNHHDQDTQPQQPRTGSVAGNGSSSAANDDIGACDDLGSSDEVKVFNDEDERDGDVTESYQAELQAEKTSLIHESEQVLLFLLTVFEI